VAEHHDSEDTATSFLRFCIVGGIGFIVDATVLLTLIHGFSGHPILSRFFSFAVAVAVTFELNRAWTFGSLRLQHLPSAFASYVGVQGVGFICNLAVYALAFWLLQLPPFFCLVIASAVALVINYLGAKRLVFRGG